jgi:hypothetical protein
MNPSLRFRGGWLSAFLGALLAAASAFADQTVINKPIAVPLERVTVGRGKLSYEKLGIWASIGKGTPQLFEFDTGGDGFYAVHAPGITPWWGREIVPSERGFKQAYSSGYVYTGRIVTGEVSIYDSEFATKPLITTFPGVSVGQTRKIINSKDKSVLWTSDAQQDTSPPIDSTFYGDFGVSLVNKGLFKSQQTATNVFAQLRYGPGVHAGFVVHAGPHGSRNASYVQIGITPAEMAAFPIQIPMESSATAPFPHSGLPSYGLQLFKGDLHFQLGAESLTKDMQITIDTGNQTPVIFTTATDTTSEKFGTTRPDGSQILTPGSSLEVALKSGPTIFGLTAGLVTGVNKVEFGSKNKKESFNIGLPFFNQYIVAFDLTTGTIGLLPQPKDPLEASIFGPTMRHATQARFTLTGKASGEGLRGVLVQVNGRKLRASGSAKWRATITLQPGRNIVKATALGHGATSRAALSLVILP